MIILRMLFLAWTLFAWNILTVSIGLLTKHFKAKN